MRIYINVRIENEPGDAPGAGYGMGSMTFGEDASFIGAGFETVSRVFTRCHELLAALKTDHNQRTPGAKLK